MKTAKEGEEKESESEGKEGRRKESEEAIRVKGPFVRNAAVGPAIRFPALIPNACLSLASPSPRLHSSAGKEDTQISMLAKRFM